MWYFCGAKQTLRLADDGPIQIGMARASEAPDVRRSLPHTMAAASDSRQKPPLNLDEPGTTQYAAAIGRRCAWRRFCNPYRPFRLANSRQPRQSRPRWGRRLENIGQERELDKRQTDWLGLWRAPPPQNSRCFCVGFMRGGKCVTELQVSLYVCWSPWSAFSRLRPLRSLGRSPIIRAIRRRSVSMGRTARSNGPAGGVLGPLRPQPAHIQSPLPSRREDLLRRLHLPDSRALLGRRLQQFDVLRRLLRNLRRRIVGHLTRQLRIGARSFSRFRAPGASIGEGAQRRSALAVPDQATTGGRRRFKSARPTRLNSPARGPPLAPRLPFPPRSWQYAVPRAKGASPP